MIAEYANGSLSKEYIYSGARLIATHEGATLKYHHRDHLSNRVTTDANGTLVATNGHYPFGEGWYETGGTNKLKFTSYERDAESGNEYAIFRYYASRLGRFCQADPVAGDIRAPQSLNRYAYVQNDPVNLVDPLGLSCTLWGRFEFEYDKDGNIISIELLYTWWECDDEGGGGGGGNPIEALVGGFPIPPPPPGYSECIMAALREAIAYGEVRNEPNNGYGTLVRGTVYSASPPFESLVSMGARNVIIENPEALTGHPGIQVRWNPNRRTSSAFGRYQITGPTAQTLGPRGMGIAGKGRNWYHIRLRLRLCERCSRSPREGYLWEGL